MPTSPGEADEVRQWELFLLRMQNKLSVNVQSIILT